jgi:capsular polysaccharide transport system ATP-binding protein
VCQQYRIRSPLTPFDLDHPSASVYQSEHVLKSSEVGTVGMIRLENVTKYYPTAYGRHYVFRDVTFEFPDSVNIGIIGRNGAGKSTLLQLLAGADAPNEGRVVRTGRISWPMGLATTVQKSLTGAENARFACRINGLRGPEAAAKIAEIRAFADVGKFFDLPVITYSSGMKGRLNFAIAVAFDFDTYLIDEVTATGDVTFVEKARATFKQKRNQATFIKCTHNMQEMLNECDAGVLLEKGQFTFFPRVEDAVEAYLAIVAPDDEDALARVLLRAERKRKKAETAEIESTPSEPGTLEPAGLEPVPPDAGDDERAKRRAERRSAREARRLGDNHGDSGRRKRGRERPTGYVPAPMAPRLTAKRVPTRDE